MMARIFDTNMLDKVCFHFPEKVIIALVNLKVVVFVYLFVLFLFLQLFITKKRKLTLITFLIIEYK